MDDSVEVTCHVLGLAGSGMIDFFLCEFVMFFLFFPRQKFFNKHFSK